MKKKSPQTTYPTNQWGKLFNLTISLDLGQPWPAVAWVPSQRLRPGHGGEGNVNPLQCSCLENSMDRGAWQATVHGVAKSQA